jgi:hypothetical protein
LAVLYYWRPDNYLRDRAFGFGYHLNQNSPAMASLGLGDRLWAFTRRRRDNLYVLAPNSSYAPAPATRPTTTHIMFHLRPRGFQQRDTTAKRKRK